MMMPIRLCECCCRDVGNTEDGWGNFCQECFDNQRRISNGTLSLEDFRMIYCMIMHDEIHRLNRELAARQVAIDNFAYWESVIDQGKRNQRLTPHEWEEHQRTKARLLSFSSERRSDEAAHD